MDNLKKSKSFLDIIREEVNKTSIKSNDFETKTYEDLLGNETNTDMNVNNGFRVPNDSDLFDNEINNSIGYSSKEEVQRYLNTIISSISDYDMSEYMNVSSGTSIVGIDELNDMIMDGYTITRAECLSVNPSMISIVYNKIIKKNEIGKRR